MKIYIITNNSNNNNNDNNKIIIITIIITMIIIIITKYYLLDINPQAVGLDPVRNRSYLVVLNFCHVVAAVIYP